MSPFEMLFGLACIFPIGFCGEQPAEKPDPEKTAAAALKKSLGVEFAVVESKVRRSITRTDTPYGFKVSQVDKDSLAAKAGWKSGDIILDWNDKPFKALVDMDAAVQAAKAGDALKYKLARHKKDEKIGSRQPWEYIEGKIVPK